MMGGFANDEGEIERPSEAIRMSSINGQSP